MILAASHDPARQAPARPAGFSQALAAVQPARIAGLAGAIALNIAALMLLLVPVSAPIAIARDEAPIFQIDLPKPKPPEPPPVLKVTPPKPHPQPVQPIQRQPPTVVPPPPVLSDATSEMAIPPPANTGTEIAKIDPPPATGPLTSETLQYALAPPPSYPREALMAGVEGTVVLKVLVNVDGTPLEVEIQRSSGNRRLDDAAKRQVLRKWKFRPAIREGRAIQVYGLVPVNFSLERG